MATTAHAYFGSELRVFSVFILWMERGMRQTRREIHFNPRYGAGLNNTPHKQILPDTVFSFSDLFDFDYSRLDMANRVGWLASSFLGYGGW